MLPTPLRLRLGARDRHRDAKRLLGKFDRFRRSDPHDSPCPVLSRDEVKRRGAKRLGPSLGLVAIDSVREEPERFPVAGLHVTLQPELGRCVVVIHVLRPPRAGQHPFRRPRPHLRFPCGLCLSSASSYIPSYVRSCSSVLLELSPNRFQSGRWTTQSISQTRNLPLPGRS